MDTSIANLVFAFSSVAAGIIAYKCSTTPNPQPAHAEKNDALFSSESPLASYLKGTIYLMKYIYITLGFLAAYLCLNYPNLFPPNPLASNALLMKGLEKSAPKSWICPHPENLDKSYILPSTFSITLLTTLLTFGSLRLLAFRQLGADFTFHLARPSGLMTSGLYAYMRHPSYTGSIGFTCALFLLWLQPKGVMGCFVPVWWAGSWGLVWGLRVWFVVSLAWMTGRRVVQEEAMLKRDFGRVWVEYAGRTKRFLPGLV